MLIIRSSRGQPSGLVDVFMLVREFLTKKVIRYYLCEGICSSIDYEIVMESDDLSELSNKLIDIFDSNVINKDYALFSMFTEMYPAEARRVSHIMQTIVRGGLYIDDQ